MLITPENKAWFLAELAGPSTPVADQVVPAPQPTISARPNPFNPRTSIAYATAAAGPVRLRILDPRGRLVRTLVDDAVAAGDHQITWDGRDDRGRDAASGVYVLELVAPGGHTEARVSLLR